MSNMRVETNAPYPNRIQWILGTYTGPFTQAGPLVSFDPRRDLEVYVDGALIPISSFTFDNNSTHTNNVRYLLYMNQSINLQGVVQVIHHMPNPPFQSSQVLPGFALLGSYSSSGDVLPPSTTLSFTIAPNPVASATEIVLTWTTTNALSIQFLANNGVDLPFSSGVITTSLSSGSYTITSGFSVTTNILMLAETLAGGVMSSIETVTVT